MQVSRRRQPQQAHEPPQQAHAPEQEALGPSGVKWPVSAAAALATLSGGAGATAATTVAWRLGTDPAWSYWQQPRQTAASAQWPLAPPNPATATAPANLPTTLMTRSGLPRPQLPTPDPSAASTAAASATSTATTAMPPAASPGSPGTVLGTAAGTAAAATAAAGSGPLRQGRKRKAAAVRRQQPPSGHTAWSSSSSKRLPAWSLPEAAEAARAWTVGGLGLEGLELHTAHGTARQGANTTLLRNQSGMVGQGLCFQRTRLPPQTPVLAAVLHAGPHCLRLAAHQHAWLPAPAAANVGWLLPASASPDVLEVLRVVAPAEPLATALDAVDATAATCTWRMELVCADGITRGVPTHSPAPLDVWWSARVSEALAVAPDAPAATSAPATGSAGTWLPLAWPAGLAAVLEAMHGPRWLVLPTCGAAAAAVATACLPADVAAVWHSAAPAARPLLSLLLPAGEAGVPELLGAPLHLPRGSVLLRRDGGPLRTIRWRGVREMLPDSRSHFTWRDGAPPPEEPPALAGVAARVCRLSAASWAPAAWGCRERHAPHHLREAPFAAFHGAGAERLLPVAGGQWQGRIQLARRNRAGGVITDDFGLCVWTAAPVPPPVLGDGLQVPPDVGGILWATEAAAVALEAGRPWGRGAMSDSEAGPGEDGEEGDGGGDGKAGRGWQQLFMAWAQTVLLRQLRAQLPPAARRVLLGGMRYPRARLRTLLAAALLEGAWPGPPPPHLNIAARLSPDVASIAAALASDGVSLAALGAALRGALKDATVSIPRTWRPTRLEHPPPPLAGGWVPAEALPPALAPLGAARAVEAVAAGAAAAAAWSKRCGVWLRPAVALLPTQPRPAPTVMVTTSAALFSLEPLMAVNAATAALPLPGMHHSLAAMLVAARCTAAPAPATSLPLRLPLMLAPPPAAAAALQTLARHVEPRLLRLLPSDAGEVATAATGDGDGDGDGVAAGGEGHGTQLKWRPVAGTVWVPATGRLSRLPPTVATLLAPLLCSRAPAGSGSEPRLGAQQRASPFAATATATATAAHSSATLLAAALWLGPPAAAAWAAGAIQRPPPRHTATQTMQAVWPVERPAAALVPWRNWQPGTPLPECVVCMEPLHPEDAVALACNHAVLHATCALEMVYSNIRVGLETTLRCPVCRQPPVAIKRPTGTLATPPSRCTALPWTWVAVPPDTPPPATSAPELCTEEAAALRRQLEDLSRCSHATLLPACLPDAQQLQPPTVQPAHGWDAARAAGLLATPSATRSHIQSLLTVLRARLPQGDAVLAPVAAAPLAAALAAAVAAAGGADLLHIMPCEAAAVAAQAAPALTRPLHLLLLAPLTLHTACLKPLLAAWAVGAACAGPVEAVPAWQPPKLLVALPPAATAAGAGAAPAQQAHDHATAVALLEVPLLRPGWPAAARRRLHTDIQMRRVLADTLGRLQGVEVAEPAAPATAGGSSFGGQDGEGDEDSGCGSGCEWGQEVHAAAVWAVPKLVATAPLWMRSDTLPELL